MDTMVVDVDRNQSFSSSVFNESSLSGMMNSIGSQILESRNIPIKQNSSVPNIQRKLAGSLVTATSLDNNRNFLVSDTTSKKDSLEFIDTNEEDNYIADFDDINFDSINKINLNSNHYFMNHNMW